MGQGIERLTALAVTRQRKRGYYGDGGGLYLQVSATGSKSWVFRYRSRQNKRLREMGLGSVQDVSLADAREAARHCRKQLLDGSDPLDVRNTARSTQATSLASKAFTFRDCAEEYVKAYAPSWRNEKHADQWRSTLSQYAYPVFAETSVADIKAALVMKVIGPLWTTKHETARRLRGRIERVLDWATAHDLRSGPNPARWKGLIDRLVPGRVISAKVKHHPALPYSDIPAFMAGLREEDGVAAAALEFTILTAARTGEVLGATWAEISIEKRLWIIPEARMKNGKEQRVPLSAPALTLLKRMEHLRRGEAVFPGQQKPHLSNMALLNVLKRMGKTGVTTHGFRSSFRDWAAECTDTSREVAEMALAHTVGNAVEAAYRRGDLLEKRRHLMALWAAFCASTPQVIPLSKTGK